MITDYMRTETPSGATFLIGTDSESFATRLKQAANGTQTPTPSDGQDGAGEEGGPIRRFTDAFGSLQMGTLEAVGLSGHEIADAIQMRVTELYRNQFPVPKSRFEVKCRECGEEFEEKVERCPECAGEVREPDPAEKRRLKQLLKSVNREGQSLRELGKALEWDQWLTGVPILVIRYDYHLQDGEVIQREPNELVKGDPKRIVPVVDENNRIGNWWWACPKCRHEDGYKPEEQDGWCEECDARLREVYFAEQADQKGDDMDAFYFREEILTFPWAFPRLHGLDGLSPVHHIWLKQVIIDFQDAYAGAFYDPESERLPNQFIVLHTTNPDAWEERLREARENSKDDVYDSPVFANQYSPQDASTPEVQVVDAMPDQLLGQNEQLKEQLKKDIRQAINIADVFDSDLKDAGGLNNEGLQIEVTDRSIATQQHDYTEGWLDTLTKRLGIQDWSIGFIPATGPDAEDLQKEVKAGMMADQAGLDATMEDGQTTVADGQFDAPEQSPGMDAGPGGGLPGDSQEPPDEENGGDEEGGDFFSDGPEQKQAAPDNATHVSSPDEIPEDAEESGQGPRGGWWYVPSQEGGEGEELSISDLEEGDEVRIDAEINVGGETHDISDDPVEVVLATENGIAIDHAQYGRATLTPDEIDSITEAEEGATDADPATGAPTADTLSEEEVVEANQTVMDTLVDRHGSDVLEDTGGGVSGAETITDSFEEWDTSGYWDSHAEPIWEAMAAAGSGDGEIPDRARGDNEFRDGTKEVAEDTIQASREYAKKEIFGDNDTITVYRGVTGELGEQIQEAKKNGEPVQVDPRAMESWSMDEGTAEGYGAGPDGAVMKREISVDDVGLVPSVFNPDLRAEQEITTVDNGPVELAPDQIET